MFLVVSTSAVDCLEKLVSEMTCYVSSGTLNPTHPLTHSRDEDPQKLKQFAVIVYGF